MSTLNSCHAVSNVEMRLAGDEFLDCGETYRTVEVGMQLLGQTRFDGFNTDDHLAY